MSGVQLHELLAAWDEWLTARTDELLSLEERAALIGSLADQADIAAAFVARKAIAERLAAVQARSGTDPDAATALTHDPLVDTLGGPVGSNLDDAAQLLTAIVGQVETRLAALERATLGRVEQAAAAERDLAAASPIAHELGLQVHRVERLGEQLRTVATGDLAALASVAADIADARRQLEADQATRTTLLEAASTVDERIQRLQEVERRVRELAERCRAKVQQAPALAIPSVAALAPALDLAEIESLPWGAARPRLTEQMDRVARLEAALAEAERRFRAPLDERDRLRGLLDAFRDKAASRDAAEVPELERLYRRAADLLWAAPCDLDRAGELVDRFVADVNSTLAGHSPQVGR